jgi:hypothetical protein
VQGLPVVQASCCDTLIVVTAGVPAPDKHEGVEPSLGEPVRLASVHGGLGEPLGASAQMLTVPASAIVSKNIFREACWIWLPLVTEENPFRLNLR